jgi:hypothetical protein
MDTRAIERQITVDYHGTPCHVTVRPLAHPDAKAELEQAGPDRRAEAELNILSDVIVAWDLKDDEDRPYPATTAALGELPADFILALWQAIAAETRRFANQLEAAGTRRKKTGLRLRRRKGA